MAIPAVIHIHPWARRVWTMSGARLVRSPDMLGEPPLAELLLERARRNGLAPFFIAFFVMPPADPAPEEEQGVRSMIEAFQARHDLPGMMFDCSSVDQEEVTARQRRYADAMPEAADEPHAVVDLHSLLLDQKDWERLFTETRSSEKTWGSWCGFGWEYAPILTRAFWRHVATHQGVQPPVHVVFPPHKDEAEFIYLREASIVMPAYEPALRHILLDAASPLKTLRVLHRQEPWLLHPSPRHVGVELTNEDSLPNRLRSPYHLSDRPRGFLSEEHFAVLLESLPRLGSSLSVDFWDSGEPLLHPNAIDWIKKLAAADVRVDLYTNGLALDEAVAERLLASGVDAIFFRLDAATAETYGKVSGDAAAFARALDNLEALQRLKAARFRQGLAVPTLVVQLTEMPETAGDVEAFFERFDRRSRIEETLQREIGRMPREDETVARLRAEGCMIEHAMLRHDNLMRGRVTRVGGSDYSPLQRFACRQLLDGPYLLWDGRIVLCREDYNAEVVVGDLPGGLDEVWRGAGIRDALRLQTGERWNESDLCRPCREWYYGFR